MTEDVARSLPAELPALDDLERLLRAPADPPAVQEAVAQARERAEELAAMVAADGDAGRLAALTFVAEAFAILWLERRWTPARLRRLVADVANVVGLSVPAAEVALFLGAVRERHLRELPPKLGIEAHLRLLLAFAPATEASLWMRDLPQDRTRCVLYLGDGKPSRRARAVALAALGNGTAEGGARGLLHAVPVTRWNEPYGAVVIRTRPESRDRALALGRETALVIGGLLELEMLLERNAERERSLVESSERRLVRLGFDLHDGPMQDIAALAQDLRLFRTQLTPLLASSEKGDIAIGRIDDLEAQLVGLDRELRELAHSLHSPHALRTSFAEALERETKAFADRHGIETRLDLTGNFDTLTSSQKIALLRVVQEALNNAQEHSGASAIAVAVAAGRRQLSAEVVDNGRGFDVDERLIAAAKAGRLGLVGMGERIRLLGGRFDVSSQPGGPTRVKASLPRWTPLAAVDGQA